MQFQIHYVMKRIFVITLLFTFISITFAQSKKTFKADTTVDGLYRIYEALELIENKYVDSSDLNKLSESAVSEMLRKLDPHSIYISSKDVQKANEALQGNFEGVGVSFQIIKDTIYVTDVIKGGPAEHVGIRRGDRIIAIDTLNATGDTINNQWVPRYMRGPKGSQVVLTVLRGSRQYTFNLTRGRVPIYSVDNYFLTDDSIGYLRLLRFSRTSDNEVTQAIKALKDQGMKALVLDLRGNTGGYLDIATRLANEFIPKKSLIVYTQGRHSPRRNIVSNYKGCWREQPIVVLIDEGSASASEILSGAIQDWDRGILVGRRSFGKGLVQQIYTLRDGAQIRLTTARYYTPSGRCIQKPYAQGTDEYQKDYYERYKHGELVSADSIHFPDSLRYTTHAGRIVYGGGGIMPDIFVPIDTTKLTDYYVKIREQNLFEIWCMQWADQHRAPYEQLGFDYFLSCCDSSYLTEQFTNYVSAQGIDRDSLSATADQDRILFTDQYIPILLKAIIAKDLYGVPYYFRVIKDIDKIYLAGIEQARKQISGATTK